MIPDNAPQWLKDARTENADVTISQEGHVIWYDGEWYGGEWRDGEWRDGVWYGGEWRGGVWRGGEWRGGVWRGKKTRAVRTFVGLYPYRVMAFLFDDGSRWVKMGCLFKSLEEWEQIGIRKSNLGEFPDNGSEGSEERVAAFEFAKSAALRMKP